MNRKNGTQNKSSYLMLLSAIALAGFLAPFMGHLEAVDSCKAACNMYVSCTEKSIGRKASAEEKKTLSGGCLSSCKKPKYQKDILKCYSDSKKSENSCSTYTQCIMNSMQK